MNNNRTGSFSKFRGGLNPSFTVINDEIKLTIEQVVKYEKYQIMLFRGLPEEEKTFENVLKLNDPNSAFYYLPDYKNKFNDFFKLKVKDGKLFGHIYSFETDGYLHLDIFL